MYRLLVIIALILPLSGCDTTWGAVGNPGGISSAILPITSIAVARDTAGIIVIAGRLTTAEQESTLS